MNTERFQKILEAYGTREESWPAPERHDAQQFAQDNTDARKLLQEFRQLDLHLDEYLPRSSPAIRENILGNLTRSPLDSFIKWLVPEFRSDFWHPLAASALPLVIGIVIGTNAWVSVPNQSDTGSFASWETEETYFLALDNSSVSMESLND